MNDFQEAILIVAASTINADMYYASRFLAPDPFIFLQKGARKWIAVSDLELDRARAQADVTEVLPLSRFSERLREQGSPEPGPVDLLAEILKELGINSLVVPASFGLELAESLRAGGYRVDFKKDPFWDERLRKSPEEISFLAQALRATEEVLALALETLRQCTIRDGLLYQGSQPLTAESLRRQIHHGLLDRDCVAEQTIVACGDQGCDPHEEGKGPLLPHQSIILDIFPRSLASRYHADITRTVVKGTPSDGLKKLFDGVIAAQEEAFSRIRAGVTGQEVHEAVSSCFERLGLKTGEVSGRRQGFFHGTGHGLGLDVHELPRLGKGGGPLEAGNVVTVEPGLYCPGIGGVRLEDVVVVREAGCENLTRAPKFLQL